MRTLAVFLTLWALLQQPPAGGQTQRLVVTVMNDKGQYVQDLKQDDFVVEEDGVRQTLSKFSPDSDTPISMGILIDKSASMRLPLAVQGREKVAAALIAANGAARVLVKLMKPQDEFLLMTFDEDLHIKQGFTVDQKKITDLLNKNNVVGGSTHLYKSAGEAIKETRKKAKNRRRALVVITDVHDTSGAKVEELQATVREQEVPVYTFGMRWDAWGLPGEDVDPGRPVFEEAILNAMAADSGGKSMVVDIPDLLSDFTITHMIDFVHQIAAELRGQYTLEYRSATPGSAAEKAIRVKVATPEYQVRFRRDTPEKPGAAPKK